MFGMKKRNQPRLEGLLSYPPPQHKVVYVDGNEPRPCWVKGRKAVFHRWANTANPVLPRGMEPGDERARYYQYRSTQAIVEYLDGSVERVWPQEIVFADAGHFADMTWEPKTQAED